MLKNTGETRLRDGAITVESEQHARHALRELSVKTIDPQQRLADSYPGPDSPPRAQDGGPELEPAPIRLPLAPIARCELGPCRNYHVMTSMIDAQSPLDGSEAAIHTTTTRSCYPSPGIAIELDGDPVRTCNRWDPISSADRAREEQLEQSYASDLRGRTELAEFNASWKAVSVHQESDAGIG